jgi:hypothetical protein
MLVGLKFLIGLGSDLGSTWTGSNLRTRPNGFTSTLSDGSQGFFKNQVWVMGSGRS